MKDEDKLRSCTVDLLKDLIRDEDPKSGFSTTIFIFVIDGKVAVSSKQPRFIKQAFDFQLKQHLDYELRFKKRDQERVNANFALGK